MNQDELQHYLNKYYYFYNFERCHSSLNTKTPFQTLQKFLNKVIFIILNNYFLYNYVY
ncbi:hypothetical protein [Spiroplasma endosymbiont of 'Nebria riversi']|uniref:hypothetical protein n=1 Tax=Spiroplasma endosymbiont of 'Nebria riversi' TaxID=2792084 RepID=UPI00350F1799